MLHQFGSLINSQTWQEEERVSKQELRAALLETACRLDEENCTAQAKTIFLKYKESNGTFRCVCACACVCLADALLTVEV